MAHLLPVAVGTDIVVFGGLSFWPRFSRAARVAWTSVVVGLIVFSTLLIGSQVRAAYRQPPTWDYRCFWLYGRAAVTGHNPYDPAAMHALDARPAPPSDSEWTRETLDVGMVYPPGSILLFAPLGKFETLRAGIPLWYSMVLAALIAVIVLLWNACFRRFGWYGFLATAALVVTFPATLLTIKLGQTIFLLSVFLLIYWQARSPLTRGIALGLAFFVKPWSLILLVGDAIARRWRVVAAAVATLVVTTAAAIPLIGTGSIRSYLFDSPIKRFPGKVLAEPIGQSLLSVMLRATHAPVNVDAETAMRFPLYIAAALLLIVATIAALTKVKNDVQLELGLLIPLALIIYPESGTFYGVAMLIPICIAWERRALFPGGLGSVLIAAAVVSAFAFWGWMLVWVLFLYVALFGERRSLGLEPLRAQMLSRSSQ